MEALKVLSLDLHWRNSPLNLTNHLWTINDLLSRTSQAKDLSLCGCTFRKTSFALHRNLSITKMRDITKIKIYCFTK